MSDIDNVRDVELIPGFEVLEHTPGSSVVKMPSNFVLKIRRMGPYLVDMITDPDMKDPGPFMITVLLMAKANPPGIEKEILYELPMNEDGTVRVPDRTVDGMEQAWINYQMWRLHQRERRLIAIRRGEATFDLALLNCVDIVECPYTCDSTSWLESIKHMIDTDEMTKYYRLLLFYKTQILTTVNSSNVVDFFLNVEEVDVDGLKRAFDSFRRSLGRAASLSNL